MAPGVQIPEILANYQYFRFMLQTKTNQQGIYGKEPLFEFFKSRLI
jgi:hypothetical protein